MEEYIEDTAKLLKVIADESKIKILYYLAQEPSNVTGLVDKTGIEQSNLSHHLRTLRENHLVRSKRQGKSMIYSLDDHHVYEIITQVLKHVAHLK